MARKNAAERCGLVMSPDDTERVKELFEDEAEEGRIIPMAYLKLLRQSAIS